MGTGGSVPISMIHICVSVAIKFVHFSTAAYQRYHAFGELARFVYCLLQKTMKASTMPLVKQGEKMAQLIRRFLRLMRKTFFPALE